MADKQAEVVPGEGGGDSVHAGRIPQEQERDIVPERVREQQQTQMQN